MTIRFGIIGAGAIAQASCREIAGHPDAELSFASDPHRGRLERLCRTYGIPRQHESPDELLADDAIDAVYVAVPNRFHAPLAIAALEAGKHLLLEKPFATSMTEAREVTQAAAASGKQFMVGMNQRFAPAAQRIKSVVSAGALGEIYHLKAYWMRRTGIPRLGTWFGAKELSGGGSILDIGVHMLDLALYLVDNFSPLSVTGATYTNFGHRGLGEGGWGLSDPEDLPFDVDDFATALIRLSGGVTIALDASWAMHQREGNRMNVHLYGTEAGASVNPPELHRFGERKGEYEIVEMPQGEPTYPHGSRFHNFINGILGREELCVTSDQALAVQAIIDGVYASCREGREIDLTGWGSPPA